MQIRGTGVPAEKHGFCWRILREEGGGWLVRRRYFRQIPKKKGQKRNDIKAGGSPPRLRSVKINRLDRPEREE